MAPTPHKDPVRFLAVVAIPLLALALGGCGGRALRASVGLGPRLTTARLGDLRGAMTYDGDWIGGTPPHASLNADLELAARRGVELLVDMRSPRVRESVPLRQEAQAAGIELVEIDLLEGLGADQEPPLVPISDDAIDRIRAILDAPGRRRTLVMDDDGTLASAAYAVHLAVDENVPVTMALQAARATGITDGCEEFVKLQVQRIQGARLRR